MLPQLLSLSHRCARYRIIIFPNGPFVVVVIIPQICVHLLALQYYLQLTFCFPSFSIHKCDVILPMFVYIVWPRSHFALQCTSSYVCLGFVSWAFFSKLLYFTIRNPLHSCNVDDFPKCGSIFPGLIMTTDEFQESMK